ncbi:hypothetical protein MMC13_000809 [Lambiella insularis]|nr:hypothetical protein [Lambiella insularis]
MRPLLYSCATDLRKIREERHDVNPKGGKRFSRTVSAFKGVLRSEQFQDSNERINEHLQSLTLEIEEVDIQQNLLLSSIMNALESASTDAHAHHSDTKEQSAALWTLQTASQQWQEYSDSVREAYFQANLSLLERVATKLEALPSASDAQVSKITKNVEQIQLQVQSQTNIDIKSQSPTTPIFSSSTTESAERQQESTGKGPPGAPRQPGCGPEEDIPAPVSNALSGCIDRLCRSASLKPGMAATGEAEAIIDDLEILLTAVQSHGELSECSKLRKSKRKAAEYDSSGDAGRSVAAGKAVKQARRALAAFQNIEIGPRHLGANTARRKGMVSHAESLIYDIRGIRVMISHYSRKPVCMQDLGYGSGQGDRHPKDPAGIASLEGRISVLVPMLQAANVNLYFHKKIMHSGINLLNPVISFQQMRPAGSYIFEVVVRHDVKQLLDLLRSGEASLHDCDASGRSLLNVSLLSYSYLK